MLRGTQPSLFSHFSVLSVMKHPLAFHTALRYLLLCLLCCSTAGPATAAERVVDLSAYGILPDADRLASRIDSVLRLLQPTIATDESVVLRLEPGIYHLHSSDAPRHTLYITNHDQTQPKPVGLMLDGWKHLTLEGQGAMLLCHGRMLPLVAQHCTDLTVQNLHIDFDQPQIAQIQVLKNEGERGITFEVAPWVNYRLVGDNHRFETYGEGWALQQVGGIAFERDTRHIVYNTGDIGVCLTGLHDLGGRHILSPQWHDARLIPGTVIALRTWQRPHPGIFLHENRGTTLRHLQVHYAEGMGLVAYRCEDITLDRFDVCVEDGSLRYFTTQADATHFSQCKGTIKVCDGVFEGMMDDAINVHGIYLKVTERLDDHTLRCAYGHNQAWGFAWGDVGDEVCFLNSRTMDYVGAKNVITAIRPADTPTWSGCHEMLITLRHALPAEVQAGACGIENLTWTPEVLFARNLVRNNRARGALFSSPRRTVCEDNLFDHTSGSAIVLCGDCNGWFESGSVRHLVVRGNRFVNALTSDYQFTNAVISIYPEIPDLKGQRTAFHGGAEGSIRIERNEFDTYGTPLLYLKSADGVVFRKNKVRHNKAYPPRHSDRREVIVEGK